MYCSKCGKQLPNDARFCEFCGEGLESQSSVTNNENGTTWTNGTVKGRLTTTNKVNKTRYFRDKNGVLKKKNVFITVGEVMLVIVLWAIMIAVAVSIFSNGSDLTGKWTYSAVNSSGEYLSLNADNTYEENITIYGYIMAAQGQGIDRGTFTKDGSQLTLTNTNARGPFFQLFHYRFVDGQLLLYSNQETYDAEGKADYALTK